MSVFERNKKRNRKEKEKEDEGPQKKSKTTNIAEVMSIMVLATTLTLKLLELYDNIEERRDSRALDVQRMFDEAGI